MEECMREEVGQYSGEPKSSGRRKARRTDGPSLSKTKQSTIDKERMSDRTLDATRLGYGDK